MYRFILYAAIAIFSFACSPYEDDVMEEIVLVKGTNENADSTDNKNGNVALAKTSLIYANNSKISVKGVQLWMKQIKGGLSNQGADCFQKYLCQFRVDHTSLEIFDMEAKKHLSTINLQSLGNSYHCNNADFCNSYYDLADEFPLLYSSHQGKNARCILVDRIYIESGEYKIQTVQRIDLPYDIDEPLQYTPDAIVDKENNYLYVYTGNTTPITDFFVYKFRLPALSEGNIRLTRKDLISSWVISGNPSYYKQGGMIKDNVLYVMEGVPGWNSDNKLRIIDFSNNTYSLFNLSELFNARWEPEDIFLYDNRFYIASNRSGIFQLEFGVNEY